MRGGVETKVEEKVGKEKKEHMKCRRRKWKG
jgi:hypothetical protein